MMYSERPVCPEPALTARDATATRSLGTAVSSPHSTREKPAWLSDKGTLANPFYMTIITLIPKPGKDSAKKINKIKL